MRSIFLFATAILTHQLAFAQLSHGGLPYEWQHQMDRELVPVAGLHPLGETPTGTMPGPDGGGFDYGVQRFLQVDVPAMGQWTFLSDGWRLCRMAVASPGAVMLSLQFDRWNIPEGALVYLYDAARTKFIGAFDHTNRGPEGTLATAVIPGDQVIIEYRLPPGASVGELRVASLTHGYLDIFGFSTNRDIDPGYQSAPCQVNINCPEGAGWQDQKRAVALFLRPTGGGCTGVLLNNTAVAGTPYFHVAAHCYQPNTSEWVFYFNYEAAGCVGTSGNSDQSLTGAQVRSSWYYTDFVLLELFNTPPPAYNVFYAGWDRSGATPASGTVIHHPLYDVKKITKNNGPVTEYIYTGDVAWQTWRNYWDIGLIEAVASGAPMFDQNKRVVGHMFNGAQDCTNASTEATDCAKFSASWNGNQPNQRLRDWLDPSNTVMFMDGYDPNGTVPTVNVRTRAYLEGPFVAASGVMHTTLRANGLVPLTEPYTAAGYMHVAVGGGETTTNAVLQVTGANAIVDWVVLELRNKNNSQQILATRSALIQADGDIVDVDGISDVTFNMPHDQYFIAVKHRNHLGIMTAAAILLNNSADLLDIGGGGVTLYGANATKTMAGKQLMFCGDVNSDGTIKYAGEGNDRDLVLTRIGGVVPTNTTTGYHPEDVNMNGVVSYTGTGNDRDSILVNIGGVIPTNTRQAQLP